jgi:hypothetical protein
MRSTEFLIPSLFRSFGLTAKLDEHRLMVDWARIVGPQIAGHTAPRDVRGKVLWVVVDSSTWLHELTLLKPLLLEKIGPCVRTATIQDVRFVIGEVPVLEAVPTRRQSPVTPLPPEDEAAVDRAVSVLNDSEIRESARRLLRTAAASRPDR